MNRACGAWRLAAMLLAALLAPPVAQAQRVVKDPAALQAVALFQRSCLPFAGMPRDLRSWAMGHNLPPVAPDSAEPLLGGEPGVAFYAKAPAVRMMLISNDTGACRVVMQEGDKANVDNALLDYFTSLGAAAAQTEQKASADGKVHQTMWIVNFRQRSWLVSTTTHVQDDSPGAKPLLVMIATNYDRGGPRP
jgi:hypothetical protein